MHINSLEAYDEAKEHIPRSQLSVLKVISKMKKATRQDIAEALGWPINRVTPRVTELLDNDLLEENGVDRSSGRARALLAIKPPAEEAA